MDPENLISKKDVLLQTGISYGQFYRWKRKGLIPESWFIRKSTFTGQETFLPREKILERLQKIQSLKDGHSLEELAQVLAPEVSGRAFSGAEVEAMAWITAPVRQFYEDFRSSASGYAFHDLFCLAVVECLRQELDDEELALAVSTLQEHRGALGQGGEFHWMLSVVRKPFERALVKHRRAGQVSLCCVHQGPCRFDALAQTAVQLDLFAVLEDIKLKLSGLH